MSFLGNDYPTAPTVQRDWWRSCRGRQVTAAEVRVPGRRARAIWIAPDGEELRGFMLTPIMRQMAGIRVDAPTRAVVRIAMFQHGRENRTQSGVEN